MLNFLSYRSWGEINSFWLKPCVYNPILWVISKQHRARTTLISSLHKHLQHDKQQTKTRSESVKCLCLQTPAHFLFLVYVERSSDVPANEKGGRLKRQMHCDAHSALNEGQRMWGRRQGGKLNIPISHTGNSALLELHHVAGESSCLVWENVLHLKGKKHRTR